MSGKVKSMVQCPKCGAGLTGVPDQLGLTLICPECDEQVSLSEKQLLAGIYEQLHLVNKEMRCHRLLSYLLAVIVLPLAFPIFWLVYKFITEVFMAD